MGVNGQDTTVCHHRKAAMFVGQGSQTVGMTKDVLHLPEVKNMYDTAQNVLGYDIKKIILEGPASQLDDTLHAQPALLIAGLAAAARDLPSSMESTAALGLSVGEFTALVHAKAMSFEDALSVVAVRAKAMANAAQDKPGKMATIIGLDDDTLEQQCRDASADLGVHVSVSNYLFPRGRVIAGDPRGVDRVAERSKQSGKRVIVKPLQVSGAFHTSLMASAQPHLRKALENVKISMPRIPVISNVTGRPYESVDEIRERLVEQVVQPVRWDDSVRYLIDVGVDEFCDMGPRQTLVAMLRKINPTAGKKATSVDV